MFNKNIYYIIKLICINYLKNLLVTAPPTNAGNIEYVKHSLILTRFRSPLKFKLYKLTKSIYINKYEKKRNFRTI